MTATEIADARREARDILAWLSLWRGRTAELRGLADSVERVALALLEGTGGEA